MTNIYDTPLRKIGPLTLSKLEAEILWHRMTAVDCLCDALGVDAAVPSSAGYHPQDVELVAELLMRGDWNSATSFNDRIRDSILIDCVDGGTFIAAVATDLADGDTGERAKFQRYIKAATRLAAKISDLTGCHCEYPMH